MPWRRAATFCLRAGNTVDNQEKKRQRVETNANCMIVRVAGLGNALSIAFEEVLVRALEAYQTIQRICQCQGNTCTHVVEWSLTTSFGDTGAFKASEIS